MRKGEIEKIEVDLLIEAIRKRYGYDFSNYARASVRRRIQKRLGLVRRVRVQCVAVGYVH